MRFREIVRYELEHRARSASTWIFAAILFGLAFLMQSGGGSPPAGIHANAPYQLAFLSLILGLFGIVVSAAIFSDAAVRDAASEMDPLLFTSPMSKAEYLGGRFFAALVTNAVVLLAIPLGLAMPQLTGLGDPSSTFGPFRVAAYMQPWLVLTVPNVMFTGAVLFTIGVLARQAVPVFMGAIGLFVATMLALGPGAEGVHPLLSVFGPRGFHALNELTEYWTPAEQNARLIGLPANLLWNRVFWLALGAAVLGVLHRVFRMAHPDGGRRRRDRRPAVVETAERPDPVERLNPVSVPRAPGVFGVRTTARQTLAVARRSLAEVAGSLWFVVVLVACVLLTMLWGWNVGSSVFDTSTWPVTLLVAGTVLSQRINPLVYLLIALFAGELVWKQRDVGTSEIADAAPVPEGVALLGRFLALVAVILMILAATVAGGILIQAFQGYYRFEVGLYLRIVFGLNLADYLLIAVLAMAIHVVVNHKYLGHVMVVLSVLLIQAAGALGIQRKLLVYGSDPGWTYSDMNGFAPFIEGFVWFKLYWAAWALLLGLAAVLLWVRGPEAGLRHRLRQARARLTGPAVRVAGVAVLLIGVFGGFIFYNTSILNELDDLGETQAEYEKRYARFGDAPQPTITAARLRVEIYPDQSAVDFDGTYTLRNRTDRRIDSVHVYLDPAMEARSLSLDRNAEPVLVDEAAGFRVFALARPLQPGDSLRLEFDVAYRPRGFRNSGFQTEVVDNGAFFTRKWLPFIGYQPAFELSGDEARERFDLAPKPPTPGPDDARARQQRWSVRNEDLVHVDATIGTAADQTAITIGALRRSWEEDGRRYFHYETEAPTGFSGAVVSAEYALLEDRWNDVALQVFYHPTHDYNLDRMVRGMKASLEYFTAQFGPYPDRRLRVVEFPRYGGFGHAGPHTIAFAEDAFLSRVEEGEVDQPFYGTAHEVAHQWWGGQVRGAPVRGHGLLSESLANYSAMMVTEKTYGPEVARRVYNFQLERYLRGRATQSQEVPLLEVTDQPYIAYRKGAIAMYAMREHIGEEAVNTALRRYLEKHRDAGPPYPTSLDLYAELRAVTPDSQRYLLTDWFETITLWDVRVERATFEPTGTGEYVVTMDVRARKMRADSVGNETEIPMDDLVEIGVFTGGPPVNTDLNLKFDQHGDVLYLQRHRIRSGEQTIRITVPREPRRAGIDPYRKLIDRQRDDNVAAVSGTALEQSPELDTLPEPLPHGARLRQGGRTRARHGEDPA